MKCTDDISCPSLYTCQSGECVHQPLTNFSYQLISSLLLIPILTSITNRVGSSTVWLIYPILTTIMSYKLSQSFSYISPIVMSSSCIMLFLSLKQKSQNIPGPTVNFYVVGISIPMLVCGCNLGLILSKIIPQLYISVLGLGLASIFIFFGFKEMKDMQADEKISIGFFRKMLPSRLQNSRKFNPTIQMALIQQADGQYDHHQQQLSPTRKTLRRSQLLIKLQSQFPIKQLAVCLVCFAGYQCFCILIPFLIQLSSLNQIVVFAIAYLIIFILMVIGEIILYLYYVKPIAVQSQQNKINLKLGMDSSTMLKICLISFFGGYCQGFIGFGLYFSLFLYLLHCQSNLKNAISTCGFLTIFIAIIFTCNSIFCTNFNWISYICIFFITLICSVGSQLLLDLIISKNIKNVFINSTLIILSIVIMFMCLGFIIISLGLNWKRFGFSGIGYLGYVPKC